MILINVQLIQNVLHINKRRIACRATSRTHKVVWITKEGQFSRVPFNYRLAVNYGVNCIQKSNNFASVNNISERI